MFPKTDFFLQKSLTSQCIMIYNN